MTWRCRILWRKHKPVTRQVGYWTDNAFRCCPILRDECQRCGQQLSAEIYAPSPEIEAEIDRLKKGNGNGV